MSIGIVDYGMGNLRSVQKGFERVGADAIIFDDPDRTADFDHLVLPGVGAFRDAITTLRQRGWVQPLREFVNSGRPFLGICLGLQLLFDVSYEDGRYEGLSFIPGEVVRFDFTVQPDGEHLKIPHMGWNQITWQRDVPLFKGLDQGCFVYFVHSYYVAPSGDEAIASITEYGGPFVSSVWRDNLLATQFHPEKSQNVGLKMLENFAAM